MKISVIGGGYVGLVTGSCFASLGHAVTIIDIDPEKIRLINRKKPPFYEDQLEEILINEIGSHLFASTDYSPVHEADLIFICVGTPPNPDGSANLEYLRSAARTIGLELKSSRGYPVIVIKSTVPPGTTENLVQPGSSCCSRKNQ